MNIRLETPKDYREVENLTREAFWNVYRPGCTEHYVLNQYRTNPYFIPELDFVMEENEIIIGHVMFSKAEITLDDGTVFPSWTFGPISVHPDYKRKGYGLKLLQYAIEKAKEMGIGLLQMEGNIEFYRYAGFDLAKQKMAGYMKKLKPAAYELCYQTDEQISYPLQIKKDLKGKSLIWYNTLWDTLCGGHDDDLALEDPDAAFGFLIHTLGARIIQTDRAELLLNYLKKNNLHP